MFQGATAWNKALVKCFEEAVQDKIIVPEIPHLMGAFGAALILKEKNINNPRKLDVNTNYKTKIRHGNGCSNSCEIVDILKDNVVIGNIGNRCEKCVVEENEK
jgi:hypothetical protein